MGKGDNMKNIDAFTGRAQAYSIARPGYPKEAIEYICSLKDILAAKGTRPIPLRLRHTYF